jgi:hypothetical protein
LLCASLTKEERIITIIIIRFRLMTALQKIIVEMVLILSQCAGTNKRLDLAIPVCIF